MTPRETSYAVSTASNGAEISIDMDAPINSSLAFEPAEYLSFGLQPAAPTKAYQLLTVVNVHPKQITFFSVKTLKPERYFIKPSKCILGPRERIVVRIELRQTLYDEVLAHFTLDHKLVTDRLLIQSAFNTNTQNESIISNAIRFKDEMKSKEKDAAWSAAWKTMHSSSIHSKNIIMKFEPSENIVMNATLAPLLTGHSLLHSHTSGFTFARSNSDIPSTMRPLFTTQETTFSIDEGPVNSSLSLATVAPPVKSPVVIAPPTPVASVSAPIVSPMAVTPVVSPATVAQVTRSSRKSSFAKREKSGLSLTLSPSTEELVFSVSPHKTNSYTSIQLENLSPVQRICYTVRIESKFRCKAVPARVGWIDSSSSTVIQLEIAISLHQEILHLLSQGDEIEAYKVRLQVMELDSPSFTTMSNLEPDAVVPFLKDLWQTIPKRMFVQKYVTSFALDTTPLEPTKVEDVDDELAERNSLVSECASFATAFTRAPPMRPIMTPLEHLQYQRSLNQHLLPRNTIEEFRPTIFDDVVIDEKDDVDSDTQMSGAQQHENQQTQPEPEPVVTAPSRESIAVPSKVASPRVIPVLSITPTTPPPATVAPVDAHLSEAIATIDTLVITTTPNTPLPQPTTIPLEHSAVNAAPLPPLSPPRASTQVSEVSTEPVSQPLQPVRASSFQDSCLDTPIPPPEPESVAEVPSEIFPESLSIPLDEVSRHSQFQETHDERISLAAHTTFEVESAQGTPVPPSTPPRESLQIDQSEILELSNSPMVQSKILLSEEHHTNESSFSPRISFALDALVLEKSASPSANGMNSPNMYQVCTDPESNEIPENLHDTATTSSSRSMQSDRSSESDTVFHTIRESNDDKFVTLAVASTTNLTPIEESNESICTPHSSFIESIQVETQPPIETPTTPVATIDDDVSGFSILTFPKEESHYEEPTPVTPIIPTNEITTQERPTTKSRFSLLKAFERNYGPSAPTGLVTITPQTLIYHMDVGSIPTSKVVLHNHTSGMVVYKIKSAQPQRYKVKPSQGFLEPLGQCSVDIGLHSAAYDELMCLSKLELGDIRDCLLVETVRVTNTRNANAIRAAGPDLVAMLRAMWGSVDKKQVNASRLFCEFSFDDSAFQSFSSTMSGALPVYSPPQSGGPLTPPSSQTGKIGFGWKRNGSNKVLRDEF